MVHARLGTAEENSGRLVTCVRSHAQQLAGRMGLGLLLADGPPGTGCPVIASISGTGLVVVVTEPTVSGVHDLERVLDLAAHFGVKAVVVINKADLDIGQAGRIEALTGARGVRILGRIPFDPLVTEALAAGQVVVQYKDGPAARGMREVWKALQAELGAPAGS
jgi:MinD superfamily P-loop ATPase